MSRLWKSAELTVRLCPDRLVAMNGDSLPAIAGEPVQALKELGMGKRLRVILSNHLVRYAVLPWSDALTAESDWTSFGQESFAAVYGDVAADWRIRVDSGAARKSRVACGVSAALLDALQEIPSIVSIQPHLMAAFNARRRALRERTFWFVVQESGRLTLALVNDGNWKLIRNRQASEQWTEHLADLLEREAAAAEDAECDFVVLCAENPVPAPIGRYRVEALH